MAFVDQHLVASALPLCSTAMVAGDGKTTGGVGDLCRWGISRICFAFFVVDSQALER
jgi:hypothetical protein